MSEKPKRALTELEQVLFAMIGNMTLRYGKDYTIGALEAAIEIIKSGKLDAAINEAVELGLRSPAEQVPKDEGRDDRGV